LRNALIRATLDLIPQTGVRQLSLREVARRAGVSHGASYRHFQDKEGLLAAVAEQGFNELELALRAAAQSAPADPIAKLQAAGVAYVEFGIRHPQHLQVMFGGAIADFNAHPSLKLAVQRSHNELRTVVAEILRGSAPGGVLNEEVVGAAAWSIVHGLTVLLADGQLHGVDAKSLAAAVTTLFCNGLAENLRNARTRA
jgi:AcrR family transcriptional regulator